MRLVQESEKKGIGVLAEEDIEAGAPTNRVCRCDTSN